MKKNNLFLVLLMALIVMSCSKDETSMSIPQEGNAIEFGTYVGRDAQTRASVIDADALKDTGFGVFAYYTDGDDYKTTSTPNFMWNTKVSTASWTYSPIKYWPNETTDKLTFFAYAPYSSTETPNNISDLSGKTATGDPTLIFTVNSAVKNQTDLLYADATNLKNLTKQSITGKVNFPFKHALSRIGFKVEVMVDKVNDDATGTDDDGIVVSDGIAAGTVVSVQEVELIGKFVNSSTFNFAAGTWTTPTDVTTTDPAYSLVYNETEESSDFVNTVAEGVTISSQVLNKDDSYIMIIPKKFDDSDQLKIRVTYKVTTTDTALEGDKSEITNVISDPFGIKFEAGKAYSFNLHLGMTSVKFDAEVTNWDVVTPETVVNVPINTESNSYIVAPNSAAIRIPVLRANASDLLYQPQLSDGDAFTAELVWTDNQYGVAANSNIKSIAVEGTGPTGYLVVEPGSAEGNAVVAIIKGGKILWSWHIWVTKETPTVSGTQGFMDRNLGAIGNNAGEVGTKGLLYQWGRKDPFPGSTTIDGTTEPSLYTKDGTTTIAKTAVTVNDNFANSVANPATFYHDCDSVPYDWYTNSKSGQNNTLWDGGSSKTIYDPCPPGWRVPKNGAWGDLSTSNFTLGNSGRTADSHGGFYPAAGYRHTSSGNFYLDGSNGYYWSATVNGLEVYHLHLCSSGVCPSYSSHRAYGFSVRCVKE